MLKAIVTLGVLQALVILVQIVRSKVIAVALGPAGLGIIGIIDQIVMTIGFAAALSLPTVVVRVLPRVHGKPAFARQYAAFLKAVIITSFVSSGALGLLLLVEPAVFGDISQGYPTELAIALGGVPLFALGLLLPNVLAASMRPVGAAWLSFGITAMATVGAAIGLVWGGIREIYISQLIATGTLLAGALLYFKMGLGLPFHDRSASLVKEIRAAPELLATAGAVYAGLVGSAFALLIVRYVTAESLGVEAGGRLQAILSMVLGVGAVLGAMSSRYLGPVLNRPSAKKEKFAIFDLFRRRQLIMLVGLSVPLVLFAKLVVLIMFSSRFIDAAELVPAFLIWQLLVIQTNVQVQLLFALDDVWTVTITSIAGAAVSALLCLVLIPPFGIEGAAAAMIAGAALTLAIGAVRLRRRHGHLLATSSLLLGCYAAAVLLAAPYAMQVGMWDAIPLKIGVCLLLIAGLWPYLNEEEKFAIRRLFRR